MHREAQTRGGYGDEGRIAGKYEKDWHGEGHGDKYHRHLHLL